MGCQEGFFFFAPGRTCQGFENIISGSYFFSDLLGVGAEVEKWVKSDSENGWIFYSWDRISFYFDWERFTLFIPPCRPLRTTRTIRAKLFSKHRFFSSSQSSPPPDMSVKSLSSSDNISLIVWLSRQRLGLEIHKKIKN